MRRTMVVTVLGVLSSLTALADPLPPRHPGEWSITQVIDGTTAQERQACYGATYDPMQALEKNAESCSKRDVSSAGSTITIDAVCTTHDTMVALHSTIAFAGDSAFHSQSQIHFDPPMGGKVADMATVSDGKWIGPCKDGEQPR